jgi:MFS family permease
VHPSRGESVVRLGSARGYPRQFWLLTAATFIYLIGVEMCYPFESIYLHGRLHVSLTGVGLILGLSLLAGLPLQMLGGTIADVFGRKGLLAFAFSASAILYLGLGLVHSLWGVVALIVYEAAFGWAMFITASNAMIADLTALKQRAEAFSINRVALNIGMVVGPLVAVPLLRSDPSYELLFLSGGVICALVCVTALASFSETKPPRQPRAQERRVGGYRLVLSDRRFVIFCAVALLPLYAFGQIWVTLPLLLKDDLGVSAQTWGVVLAFYGLVTALLQYPLVRALRGLSHLALMAIASALLGVGVGAIAFVPWGPGTFALVALASLGVVLLIPISSTLVGELASPQLRGRYMGFWTLIYMGGYALAPTLGGYAIDALGYRGAFACVIAVGVVGAAAFTLLALRVAPAGSPGADVRCEVESNGGEPPYPLA